MNHYNTRMLTCTSPHPYCSHREGSPFQPAYRELSSEAGPQTTASPHTVLVPVCGRGVCVRVFGCMCVCVCVCVYVYMCFVRVYMYVCKSLCVCVRRKCVVCMRTCCVQVYDDVSDGVGARGGVPLNPHQIYQVGEVLFYLLRGQSPHQVQGAVQLLVLWLSLCGVRMQRQLIGTEGTPELSPLYHNSAPPYPLPGNVQKLLNGNV